MVLTVLRYFRFRPGPTARFASTRFASQSAGSSKSPEESSSSSSSDEFSSNSSSDDESVSGVSTDPQSLRLQILSTALEFDVPSLGWTDDALSSACQRLGLSSASKGLFPEGPVALVVRAYELNNEKFSSTYPGRVKDGAKRETIGMYLYDAMRTRLLLNADDLDRWSEGLLLLTRPQNARRYMKVLGSLADDFWHLSGDQQVDSTWYPKRIVVSGIYQATELNMLQDSSTGFEDTWDFLNRRMRDLDITSKGISLLQEPTKYFVPFVQAASTTAANIFGWNQRRRF